MKKSLVKIAGVLAFASLIIGSGYVTQSVLADTANLVPNSSLETANASGTLPASWSQLPKGTNTVGFKYATNDAHTGTRSVTVNVTNYTSGMQGWIYDSQPVTPGITYDFSDWYKSTAPSNIVATLTMSDGSNQTVTLASVPTHAGWAQATAKYTIPAGVTSASFSQLLTNTGIVTADDFGLVAESTPPITPPTPPVTPPATTYAVPNPSLETANGSLPASWSQLPKGTSTVGYKYATGDAHTGTRSITVNVTNYTGGLQGWTYTSQPVTPGVTYDFTDWYKSTAPSNIVAILTMTDGSQQTATLATVATHGGWTTATAKYVIPPNVVSASFVHVLMNVGIVTADDFSVVPETQASQFTRPIVSLTFDDGYSNQFANARPLLNQYGYKGTYFIISSLVNTGGAMTSDNLLTLSSEGNEIGSHTVTHRDLTTLSSSDVTAELANSQAYLQNLLGIPVTDFALPGGHTNAAVTAQVKQYYKTQRLATGSMNVKTGFDPYALQTEQVDNTTTAAQIQGWIDQATANHGWLVLLMHNVYTSPSSTTISTTTDVLNSTLSYLQTKGVAVETVQQALAEVNAQL